MREFLELQASLEEREKALKELASNASGKVLDIATGSGYLVRHLLGHSGRIVGIDLDFISLQKTKNELSAQNIDFVCCDARKLPFRDGAFDSTLTWSALVHIPEWMRVVDEIFRVTRGIVVTSEPKGEYSVRAWRDYKSSHEFPTPEEVSKAFSNFGKVERLDKGFIEEIRCVRHSCQGN